MYSAPLCTEASTSYGNKSEADAIVAFLQDFIKSNPLVLMSSIGIITFYQVWNKGMTVST